MKRAVASKRRRRPPTWEQALLGIVASADPAAALARTARDRRLPVRLRRAFAGADVDGVRVATLLVAKLRFERLIRGSPEIDADFERDPRGFTETFRRYHAEVALEAFDPRAEVQSFRAWESRRLRARRPRPHRSAFG